MVYIVLVLVLVLGLALVVGLLLWSLRRSAAWKTQTPDAGCPEEDWKCPYCEALQSYDRTSCPQCGASRLAA